jgi:hypothetical protein
MRLSKPHLKTIINEELQKFLYEQESRKITPRILTVYKDKLDAIEANIRLKYDMNHPGDTWGNKTNLKLLWQSLYEIGRAPKWAGRTYESWEEVEQMYPESPWDPKDPPHWIPEISDSVCAKMRDRIKDPDYICLQRRINVNYAIDLEAQWHRKQRERPRYKEKELKLPNICPPNPDGSPRSECPEQGFEVELIAEVAFLIWVLKGAGANPYVLIAIFGAAVVWMAIDLINEVEELDKKTPQVTSRPPNASEKSTHDAIRLMRAKGEMFQGAY